MFSRLPQQIDSPQFRTTLLLIAPTNQLNCGVPLPHSLGELNRMGDRLLLRKGVLDVGSLITDLPEFNAIRLADAVCLSFAVVGIVCVTDPFGRLLRCSAAVAFRGLLKKGNSVAFKIDAV